MQVVETAAVEGVKADEVVEVVVNVVVP